MVGPITIGVDHNYFSRIAVAGAAFPTNADVKFLLRGDPSFTLINEGTGVVEYSFNGNTLHGDIAAGGSMSCSHRGVSLIWFRLKSGAASAVRVEASDYGTFGSGGSVGNISASSVTSVVDKSLAFIAGGTTSCATSTKIATGQSGAGYLTVVNLDASATIYIGLTGVTSSTGMPIPPGASDTAYYTDVATIFGTGSTTVGFGLRR